MPVGHRSSPLNNKLLWSIYQYIQYGPYLYWYTIIYISARLVTRLRTSWFKLLCQSTHFHLRTFNHWSMILLTFYYMPIHLQVLVLREVSKSTRASWRSEPIKSMHMKLWPIRELALKNSLKIHLSQTSIIITVSSTEGER